MDIFIQIDSADELQLFLEEAIQLSIAYARFPTLVPGFPAFIKIGRDPTRSDNCIMIKGIWRAYNMEIIKTKLRPFLYIYSEEFIKYCSK